MTRRDRDLCFWPSLRGVVTSYAGHSRDNHTAATPRAGLGGRNRMPALPKLGACNTKAKVTKSANLRDTQLASKHHTSHITSFFTSLFALRVGRPYPANNLIDHIQYELWQEGWRMPQK
jgi:hypothetical protein